MPETVDLKSILEPVQVDNAVKHAAWEAFYDATDRQDFIKRFDHINLPREVKRQLWFTRFPEVKQELEAKVQPPAVPDPPVSAEPPVPPRPSLMSAVKAVPQMAFASLAPSQQVQDIAHGHAIKSLGGATATEVFDQTAESARQVAEKVLGEPWSATQARLPGPTKALEYVGKVVRMVPEAVDSMMTPVGAALSLLPGMAGAKPQPMPRVSATAEPPMPQRMAKTHPMPEVEVGAPLADPSKRLRVAEAAQVAKDRAAGPAQPPRPTFQEARKTALKPEPSPVPIDDIIAATEPPPTTATVNNTAMVTAEPPAPKPTPKPKVPAGAEKVKPETPKSPTPDRLRIIMRGKHDRVHIEFPDADSSSAFDAVAKAKMSRSAGQNPLGRDTVPFTELEQKIVKKYGIGEFEARRIAMDYHEHVKDAAKFMPKHSETELKTKVPALDEFVKTRPYLSTHFKPTVSPTSDATVPNIEKTILKLEPEPDVPISIQKLRGALPQTSKAELDATLLKLRDEGKIRLTRHDNPSGLTEDYRNALIDGQYIAVAVKSKPKK